MTDEPESKLYTMHTSASIDEIRDFVVKLASASGHPVFVEEQPAGTVVGPKRAPWTRQRMFVALTINSLVAVMVSFGPHQLADSLWGYIVGWLSACIVFLW